MSKPKIVILGGGPAGLGAAWQLTYQGKASATVLEQRDTVGGNAASFELAGIPVDFGSHRLHPACQPRILEDIQKLLGNDLLKRPRHGRIRLRGRWIHFPLKPLDLAFHLPWSFSFGVAGDAFRKILPFKANSATPTFAGILELGLGSTICRDFYFPYARKIWGLEPDQLSPIQAQRRISAGSLTKMVRKVMRIKTSCSPNSGYFYYPKNGFGQISEAIAGDARAVGAEIRLNTTVKSIRVGSPHLVEFESNGQPGSIEANYVWSTIPLAALPRIVVPTAPYDVLDAAQNNESRAMILIYVTLGQPQFTEYDAHYFPESEIGLTRLSEPKNYSVRNEPRDKTVICGELPCQVGDRFWQMSDQALGELVRESLEHCSLPITAPILSVMSHRLPHAYPIYRLGYEEYFNTLDAWVSGLPNILSFGRQGLFAHDNTHHALAMSYAAVDCLDPSGTFDQARWRTYRREFEKHVVED
jgi:protoporphyrinogen oxidase